jgi:hypothetical protein
MNGQTERNETSSHFSYKDYKKKKETNAPNRDIMVFISVFIVGLLIILGFAKILSPNVDVAITKESDIIASDEDNSSSVIDDRLRRLKLEDESRNTSDEDMFSPELDEKVILPTRPRKTVGQMEAEASAKEAEAKQQQEEKKQHEEQKAVEPPKPVAQPEKVVNAKVVVGYYATEKQAEVAKSIIQDAGLSVTPIVKNLGGYYTLQVGSYTSKEKAQQAANSLLKSNFPARVILD